MEKKEKIFYLSSLILFSIFFAFFIIPIVFAVTTINSPAANTLIANGTTTFNVTSNDIDASSDGVVSLTFYAQSSLTANSTWVIIGRNVSVNLTGGNGNFVNTTNTRIILSNAILEDANNYIFNVTLNETNGTIWGVDTNTDMTIDFTIPQVPTSLSPTGRQRNSTLIFLGTVTGANTTSCTLRFVDKIPGLGSSSQTMTHSGNTCTLTISNAPEQSYRYFIRASDESNTTDSAVQTIIHDETTSAGYASQLINEGKALSRGGASFSLIENGPLGIPNWILGIVIIGIIVLVVIARRK